MENPSGVRILVVDKDGDASDELAGLLGGEEVPRGTL